jgi:hypothetical protein
VIISPNLGLLYQHTEASELHNSKIDLTGGKILEGSIGTEISFRQDSNRTQRSIARGTKFRREPNERKGKGHGACKFCFLGLTIN